LYDVEHTHRTVVVDKERFYTLWLADSKIIWDY